MSFHKYDPTKVFDKRYFKKAARTSKTSNLQYMRWALYLKKYPDPMLELGCYRGDLVKELQKRKKIVYGIDASNYCMDILKCKDILQVDAHYLPFKNNSFSTIFSFQLLEHLSLPRQCLEDCLRILRPEGYFLAKWGYGEEDITHVSDFKLQWESVLKKYFKFIRRDLLYVYQKVE